MNGIEKRNYCFKSFRLNVSERQLLNDGKPISLRPKDFDVLVFLVERAGHLVEKEEILRSVWCDSFVEEGNLARTVHSLRRALGQDKGGNKFIETVPTKGYRFVAAMNGVSERRAVTTRPVESVTKHPFSTAPRLDSYDELADPRAARPKRSKRALFLTVGFAGAISLIFLLSFSFQFASAIKPNDPKPLLQKQYTTNDEAYRLYLLGAALADKLTRGDAEKAIDAYEKAIQLDPNYAPAYARLANVHTAMAFMGGGGNPTEEYLKAKTAVEKALAIDDSLAEAHSYLGEIKTNFEWDFAGAEREHKRAVQLNPNSAAAHRMYALLLAYLGRPDESIAEIRTAIDLEPASVLNHKIYEQNLYYARRYDEAIAEGKRTLEMEPAFLGVYETLEGAYLMKGDEDTAFEWYLRQQEIVEPSEVEFWRTIHAQSGWHGIREQELEQAKNEEKNGDSKPLLLARLYTKTGNFDQAFVYLETAFDRRMQGLISLKVSPNYDPLRSDPRFEALVKRIGL